MVSNRSNSSCKNVKLSHYNVGVDSSLVEFCGPSRSRSVSEGCGLLHAFQTHFAPRRSRVLWQPGVTRVEKPGRGVSSAAAAPLALTMVTVGGRERKWRVANCASNTAGVFVGGEWNKCPRTKKMRDCPRVFDLESSQVSSLSGSSRSRVWSLQKDSSATRVRVFNSSPHLCFMRPSASNHDFFLHVTFNFSSSDHKQKCDSSSAWHLVKEEAVVCPL